eukprot:scpid25446/ scgid23646/ 
MTLYSVVPSRQTAPASVGCSTVFVCKYSPESCASAAASQSANGNIIIIMCNSYDRHTRMHIHTRASQQHSPFIPNKAPGIHLFKPGASENSKECNKLREMNRAG